MGRLYPTLSNMMGTSGGASRSPRLRCLLARKPRREPPRNWLVSRTWVSQHTSVRPVQRAALGPPLRKVSWPTVAGTGEVFDAENDAAPSRFDCGCATDRFLPVRSRREHAPAPIVMPEEKQGAGCVCGLNAHVARAAPSCTTELSYVNRCRISRS
jgi:hypothetical protein